MSTSGCCRVHPLKLKLKLKYRMTGKTEVKKVCYYTIDAFFCQPENSDAHFRGLTNPDVNRKRMHPLFCYMTLSLFS